MLQLVRTQMIIGGRGCLYTLSDLFQRQRRRTAFSFWSRRSETVTSRSADRCLSRAVRMLHDPAAQSTSTTAHWTRSKSSWSIRAQDAIPETSSSGTETLSHMQMKDTVQQEGLGSQALFQTIESIDGYILRQCLTEEGPYKGQYFSIKVI